jgi:hypothetical protein
VGRQEADGPGADPENEQTDPSQHGRPEQGLSDEDLTQQTILSIGTGSVVVNRPKVQFPWRSTGPIP